MPSTVLPSRISDEDIDFVFRFVDNRSVKHLNGDGTYRALHALGWATLERSEMSSMMANLGKDPVHGVVNPIEFQSLVRAHMHTPDGEEDVDAAFRLFDLNRTGFITLSNLRSIGELVTGSPISEQQALDILRSFDTNRDGMLDLNEFRTAVAPHLYPPPQPPTPVAKPRQRKDQANTSGLTSPRVSTSQQSKGSNQRRSQSRELSQTSSLNNSNRQTPRTSMVGMERSTSGSGSNFQRVGSSNAVGTLGRNSFSSLSPRQPSGSSPRLATSSSIEVSSTSRRQDGNSPHQVPPHQQQHTEPSPRSSVPMPAPISATMDYCPVVYIAGAAVELDEKQGTRASRDSVRIALSEMGYNGAMDEFMALFDTYDKKGEGTLTQEQLFGLFSSLEL